MVGVGDRIRLSLNKGTNREGVVTGVTGSMLRVRWSTDEETSLVPAPGTLTVLGRTRKGVRQSKKSTSGRGEARTTRASAAAKPATKRGVTTGQAASQKRAASSRKAAGQRSRAAERPPR